VVEREKRSIVKTRGRVTPAEWIARHGHSAATISLGPRDSLAEVLERNIRSRRRDCNRPERGLSSCALLEKAGLLVLRVSNDPADWNLPVDDESAADQIIVSLREAGILLPAEELIWGEGI